MRVSYASPVLEPVSADQRINPIDILRGLALFGVLYINLIGEFRVDIFQQFANTPPSSHLVDRWIDSYIPIFVELKAFALFSLLFGVGLAIQLERIKMRGRSAAGLLARRLAALLLLGIIHLTLIWNGDILTEYAVAGFIALPFLFLPRRWLGIAALIFAVRYIAPFPAYPISFPSQDWLQAHVTASAIVFNHGTFSQILHFEWSELKPLLPLHIYMMARTVALFLFGAFCWQAGLFRNLHGNRRVLLATALLGIVLGGTLTALTSSLAPPVLFGKAESWLLLSVSFPLRLAMQEPFCTPLPQNWASKRLVGLLPSAGWPLPITSCSLSSSASFSLAGGWVYTACGLLTLS